MIEIGCFVTSHGFGHAARMSAVLEALSQHLTFVPHIFTTAPETLFHQSLQLQFEYHYLLTDIGCIQHDAFAVDLEATCSALNNLIPYREATLGYLCEKCRNMRLILCDISPMGIAVARQLGIPSVLVENFTWDWLYRFFLPYCKNFDPFIKYFEDLFTSSAYHIQCQPICRPGTADLICAPVFRQLREPAEQLTARLTSDTRKIVLITLGGMGFTSRFEEELKHLRDYFFIFAGQKKFYRPHTNILLLDRGSDFYHPDLINCSDIVLCKLGYSTLAECYHSGVTAFCITRDDFAESKTLEYFAREHLQAHIISQEDFHTGRWLQLLPHNPATRQNQRTPENGADTIAAFLSDILSPDLSS